MVLNPATLDPFIQGLRQDAEDLHWMGSALAGERAHLRYTGTRAERFFADLDDRSKALEARATDLEDIAGQLVMLQADVVREIENLRRIEKAVWDFFSRVEQGAARALAELQSAGQNLMEGDFGGFAEDVFEGAGEVGDLFLGWLWRRDNVPQCGDQKWREVDRYMASKSGTHGAHYAAPALG